MAMTNEQLTKWIDEIFGTIDEIKTNSGDITGLTRSVKQLREDLTATQEDVSDLETDTAGTVSMAKAQLQHFTDGSATQALDLVADIIPVQAGSGDPSPTNVRAISGYSSVTAITNGKNFLPMTVAGIKAINTNGTWAGNVYSINNGTISILTDSDGKVTGYNVDGTFNVRTIFAVSDIFSNISLSDNESYIVNGNAVSREAYMQIYDFDSQSGIANVGNGYSLTYDSGTMSNYGVVIRIDANGHPNNSELQPMLRLSMDEDPTFAPYTANTATISLGSTIYGGTVNFTTGELIIDTASVTYEGASGEDWHYEEAAAGKNFWIPEATFKKPCFGDELLCNIALSTTSAGTEENKVFVSTGGNLNATLGDALDISTTADFKTWLSTHNMQVVAKLATPITTTLTPAQLTLLQGENNVSATSGPITLTYAPDNVLAEVYAYIQKRFDTLTASLAVNRTTRKTTKTLTKKED